MFTQADIDVFQLRAEQADVCPLDSMAFLVAAAAGDRKQFPHHVDLAKRLLKELATCG